MQNYFEISAETPMIDSLFQLLSNDKTAISCHAGDAFPTANLMPGMLCFRKDEDKLYQLKADGKTWGSVADLAPVNEAIALKANIASPALTGTPTAPTAAKGANSTQLATTAFVKIAVDSAVTTLLGDAPAAALNTLKKIGTALGNDADFTGTMTKSLAGKLNVAGGTLTGPLAGTTISATTFTGALAGNAASASKLQISRSLTIGSTSKKFDGSADVNWTLTEIGAAAASHGHQNTESSGAVAQISELEKPPLKGISMVEVANNGYPVPYGNVIRTRGAGLSGAGELLMEWSGVGGNTGRMLYRSLRDGLSTWSAWREVAYTDSSITGNAATATKLQTARKINGVAFDGTKDIELTVSSIGAAPAAHTHGFITMNNVQEVMDTRLQFLQGAGAIDIHPTGEWWSTLRMQHGGYQNGYWQDIAFPFAAGGNPMVRQNLSGVKSAWKALAYISDNVASATKLQDARTINGTNFDGTSAITTESWGKARALTIGSSSKSINGEADASWTLAEIGAASSGVTRGNDNRLTYLDLSDLDANTYYPVTIALPIRAARCYLRIYNILITGRTAAWQTHESGFSVNFEWEANPSGWGAQAVDQRITNYSFSFAEQSPVMYGGQIYTSSEELVYLRGGGAYYLECPYGASAVIRTTSYSAPSSAAVAPMAFNAALIPAVSAWPLANQAAQLQVARTINGVPFDGTRDITVSDASKLSLAGGTLTGQLTLPTFPDTWAQGDSGSAASIKFSGWATRDSWNAWVAQRSHSGHGYGLGIYNDALVVSFTPSSVIGTGAYGSAQLLNMTPNAATFGMKIVAPHGIEGSVTVARELEQFFSGGSIDVSPENTRSVVGYANGISLFGQTDGALYSHVYSANYKHQIYGDYRSGQIAVRGKNGDAAGAPWGAWRTVLDSGNVGEYALPISGGFVNGSIRAIRGLFHGLGNDYNAAGVEVMGNGGSVLPAIGFHQPGVFAGSLHQLDAYTFAFHTQGLDRYADLRVSSLHAHGWFRSHGNTGWHSETYGGGIFMEDSYWVKTYGGRSFHTAGEISASGNITAYYSDKRLKENLKPITGALGALCKLTGYRYNANDLAVTFGYDKDKQEVGLLAQDVQEIAPEVVEQAPFDRTGAKGESKTGEHYLTLKYERLVPHLVEAVKELKAMIDEQAEVIRELRASLALR